MTRTIPLAAPLAALALLLASLSAQSQTAWPVRPLTFNEMLALDQATPVTAPVLRTAALYRVSANDQGNAQQDVQRGVASTSAVYGSVPAKPEPLAPPIVADTLNFQDVGNFAMGWATMTDQGVPYLRINGSGEFGAAAVASWTTRLVVPGSSGSRELVIRLNLPPFTLGGRVEQEGEARWQARLRADLLVNGFPAWSHESMKFAYQQVRPSGEPDFPNISYPATLQQFGAVVSGPTYDVNLEGTGDDTTIGKVAVLSLGSFPAGSTVHLSFSLRADATTRPTVDGLTNNRCRYNGVRYFCSGASAQLDGTGRPGPQFWWLR